MSPTLRTLGAALATAVLVAACGGGTSESTSETQPPTTEAAGNDSEGAAAEQTSTTSGDGSASTEVSESSARVTIDGQTYEFGMNAPGDTCMPDFFGGFFASLHSPDLGGSFSVELWKEGTGEGETTSATLKTAVGDELLDLQADPEKSWPAAEVGSSFVEDFSYEGNSASGTVQFINTDVAYDANLAPLSPIAAEFEVVCAEE